MKKVKKSTKILSVVMSCTLLLGALSSMNGFNAKTVESEAISSSVLQENSNDITTEAESSESEVVSSSNTSQVTSEGDDETSSEPLEVVVSSETPSLEIPISEEIIAPSTFAAELSGLQVDSEVIKVLNLDSGTWEVVNPGDTLVVKQSVSYTIDFTIPAIPAASVAGDYFYIDLQDTYFSYTDTTPVDIVVGPNTVATWQIENNRIKIILTDSGANSQSIGGSCTIIGQVLNEGKNVDISTEQDGSLIVNIIKDTTINPVSPPSDLDKYAYQDRNSPDGITWGFNVNYKTLREYYETEAYSTRQNIILTDDLEDGMVYADEMYIGVPYYLPYTNSAYPTGETLSDKGFTVSLMSNFTEITQNTGETYAQFKARISSNATPCWGFYNKKRLVINAGTLPSASLKVTDAQINAGVNKEIASGDLQESDRAYFLNKFGSGSPLKNEVLALSIEFHVDVTTGNGIYKNKAVLQDSSSSIDAESTLDYLSMNVIVVPKEKGAVDIIKQDSFGKPVSGVSFALQKQDGSGNYVPYSSVDVVTKADGTAEFRNLVDGKYKLVETNFPSDFSGEAKYTILDGNGTILQGAEFEVEAGSTTGFVATIINQYKDISVEGTKTWNDNNDLYKERPASITVRLFADGVEVQNMLVTETVAGSSTWDYSFTGLPKFDATGTEITYTVTEDGVPSYQTVIKGNDIENTYVPKTTNISVAKSWDDASNQDGMRPASVQVQLYADGAKEGAAVTLDDSNSWKHTWGGLLESSGTSKIIYTVEEVATDPNYTETTVDNGDGTFLITNKHTPEKVSVQGAKTWNDANNQDGLRPSSVTVNLLKNGTKINTATVIDDGAGNWAYSFDNLPKYDGGTQIVYTVTEDAVAGYTPTIVGNDITNTHAVNLRDISVEKIWDDANDQDGMRPASVQVQLYANGFKQGSPATLDDVNNWKSTWTNLNENENGSPIIYTVEEVVTDPNYVATTVNNNGTFTITNKHVPEVVSVSGTKTWDDANNQDGVRPSSVTVNLLKNGTVIDTATVTDDGLGNWAYSFANLPKYDSGTAISYTVTENVPAGYTSTVNGYNIVNKYTPGETSVSVVKVWNDASNQDGIRPASVQAKLYADGVELTPAVVLDQNNSWSYTWNNLPEKASGQTIEYTVKEVSVDPKYTVAITDDGLGKFTITNSYTPETISVSGTKTWDDANNQDGKRPNTITVNLLKNGTKIDTATVTDDGSGNWVYSFANVPKYDNGSEIKYSITEDIVPGYTNTITGYDITNRYSPEETSVAVEKIWNDASNQDGVRPASIQVQLFADNVATGASVELNSANNWKHVWAGLDKNKNGTAITYKVEETAAVQGYNTSVTNDGNGNFAITNSHTPEQTSVVGTKIWSDANNQDGLRPASIKVNLLGDGVLVNSQNITPDISGNWKYSFSNLPKYNAGKEIKYTITEDAVAGYTTVVSGYDITNSYTPGKTSVTATKTWADNNNQDGIRPSVITAQLLADGVAIGSPVSLTKDGSWTYTWTNLDEKANGTKIVYTVEEKWTDPAYTSAVSTDGNGNFTISNTHTPEVISVSGTKTWDDANNQDGVRPASIIVNLLADGAKVDSQTVTPDGGGNWKYSFTNLSKYKNGVEIAYTITEDTVLDYTSTITSYDILNKHTPGKTSVSVSKVWDDGNNQDGIQPASVDVELFEDGVSTGSIVSLSSSNNWQHTWTDLDVKNSGTKIVYTVKEATHAAGYTTSINNNGNNNFVITNKHVPEVISISGEKTWDDNNDSAGNRPSSIVVNLLADGSVVSTQVVTPNMVGDWDFIFSNVPKYADGQQIVYTITENTVLDYTTTISGYNITNKYTPAKTSATVTKTWDDANDQDGKRTSSVVVQLYGNSVKVGGTVTLNAGNNWTHTWTNLPQNSKGSAVKYTVLEENIPAGYSVAVDDLNIGNMIITNTHIPEVVDVSGAKTWDDNNNEDENRPNEIIVNLLADGVPYTSKAVTANQNWAYSFTSVPKYKSGVQISYTITENSVKNYSTQIVGNDLINHYTPDRTSITVTKAWIDENNKHQARTDFVEIQLFANNVPYKAPIRLDGSNQWTNTWTGLPVQMKGQDVVYSVQEVSIPAGYLSSDNHEDMGNIIVYNKYSVSFPPTKLTKQGKLPKTGEISEIGLSLLGFVCLSLAGVAITIKRVKIKDKK